MTEKTPRDKTERARQRRLRHLRANPLCVVCLKAGKATPATELDHITPLHKGGKNGPENEQGLCATCHQEKTIKERGWEPKPTIGLDGWPVNTDRGGDPKANPSGGNGS